MTKVIITAVTMVFGALLYAVPVTQMNKAFDALIELIPYVTEQNRFMDKKNEKLITRELTKMREAFLEAKHEEMLKQDLFAPSYSLIREHLDDTLDAFKKDKKDYAHWRLKETTSLCLDCHTRLPKEHSSSFQDGIQSIERKKFSEPYNFGVAQLIVRKYPEAKQTFTKVIEDKMLRNDFRELINPFKQVLLIQTKVLKEPDQAVVFLEHYVNKEKFPEEERKTLQSWIKRLKAWNGNKLLKEGLKNDKEVNKFFKEVMQPLFKQDVYVGDHDVDLLIANGLLSNYLFENPSTKEAPEVVFWLGMTEKYLKREDFFGSGERFLKQCIRHYPKHAVAKRCYAEYEESMLFNFSGSSGTHLPPDVKRELEQLKRLIKNKN